MWKTLSRAILLSLSTGWIAFAQEKPVGPKIRAILLAPGGSSIELHTLSSETKKITGPILVGSRGISDAFSPGSQLFSFAIPDKAVEIGFRSIADITLPPAGDDFIILLEPAGETFKTHIVSGKEPRFQNDSTLFFNATDMPLGATLGEKKIVIPPRRATIGEAPAKGERPWYQVTFYEPQENAQPRIFANTRWPHRVSSRCYIFLYRSELSGQIVYHGIDETLLKEEP